MTKLNPVLLALLLTFAACAGGEDGGMEGGGAAGGAPGGMESPAGVADQAERTARIAEMRSHLTVLEAAGGDEMVPMVPTHRQRTEALLIQLDTPEMATNAEWTALRDSIRQDLTRMEGMPALELESMMVEHIGRIRRLMEMGEQGG